MKLDMSQFLGVFYEESFEGLDAMESGLLELELGVPDDESVGQIFRAAHSIKGGSGVFGLTQVVDFTHLLETLLDELRDGKRQVTNELRDVCLSSVDVLRAMLSAIQDEQPVDDAAISVQMVALEGLLGAEPSQSDAEEAITDQVATESEQEPSPLGWQVVFSPHHNIFATGNDPYRIIRELCSLGEAEVMCDVSLLPDLDELEPESAYLSWKIELTGAIGREAIEEVFLWVEDLCDIAIMPVGQLEKTVIQQVDVSQEAAPEEERRTESPRREANERRAVAKSKPKGDGGTIRVGIDKVDEMINMVGELVITQSMLSTLGENFDLSKMEALQQGLAQLQRNARELQAGVMQMRMVPISFVFSRFTRLVHDVSQQLGKKIELVVVGESTELDKTVVEKLGDPLVHLIRNSLDHGLETPDERVAANKPETGKVHLSAYHQGGSVVIEISDDGRGLNTEKILNKALEKGLISENEVLADKQIFELIFLPGFSTADALGDLSGRGVGMDVVRKNILSLGGSIDVSSAPGKGSKFVIRLPLTLAILDGQSVSVGGNRYIIPLSVIVESIEIDPEKMRCVAGKGEVFCLRGEYLSVIDFGEVMRVDCEGTREQAGNLMVIVECEGKKYGLVIDDLLSQQQVVIKSLEANYRKVDGISGATILGDGSVALIVDVPGLVTLFSQNSRDEESAPCQIARG